MTAKKPTKKLSKKSVAKKTKANDESPMTKEDWKKAAIALAKCASFTLSAFGKKGGLGIILEGPKRGMTFRWQDQFFDALDGIGYCVDRPAFYKSLKPTRKSRALS